jgi:hypothetical protein
MFFNPADLSVIVVKSFLEGTGDSHGENLTKHRLEDVDEERF